MAAPPGIGAAAAEAAQVVSGIGDVLHFLAVCIERLGIERADQVEMLDRVIAQLDDHGEKERAIVPKALRAVLLSRDREGGEPRLGPFRLIEGGKHGAGDPDEPPPRAA